jgi:hypothetical protein
MILNFHAADKLAVDNNPKNSYNSSNFDRFEYITPSGEINMSLILTRLSELSDALQNVALYPEAKVVQSHITRLNTEEYNDLISDQGLDAVLTELISDFS